MIKKHTLFIGLLDKDTHTQKISALTAREIINNFVIASGYDGATVSDATGIYKHENGDFVIEPSIRVEILFADTDRTTDLCKQLKIALNQESIALQKEEINSELI